jgi:hypothetical protein
VVYFNRSPIQKNLRLEVAVMVGDKTRTNDRTDMTRRVLCDVSDSCKGTSAGTILIVFVLPNRSEKTIRLLIKVVMNTCGVVTT